MGNPLRLSWYADDFLLLRDKIFRRGGKNFQDNQIKFNMTDFLLGKIRKKVFQIQIIPRKSHHKIEIHPVKCCSIYPHIESTEKISDFNLLYLSEIFFFFVGFIKLFHKLCNNLYLELPVFLHCSRSFSILACDFFNTKLISYKAFHYNVIKLNEFWKEIIIKKFI